MNSAGVFELLRTKVLLVRPDLSPDSLRGDRSLSELDMSSLERLDVIVETLDAMELTMNPEVLTGADTLDELTAALLERSPSHAQEAD